jgi:ataxin-3
VANDGNYSIQVLSKALQQFGNISATPIGSSSISHSPSGTFTGEQGFIAHKGNHWIAIRKVANVWYNLNSTNIVPPGP